MTDDALDTCPECGRTSPLDERIGRDSPGCRTCARLVRAVEASATLAEAVRRGFDLTAVIHDKTA